MVRIGTIFEELPDYFDWLCELVCIDGRYSDQSYWILGKILWNHDFYWSHDMDSDRMRDGLALRQRYRREGGTDCYDGPCTVLEMLIALADRIDCLLDELDGECRITMYFWEMIENLGLTNYSDQVFADYPKRSDAFHRRVNAKIDAWMSRQIDYDGRGGLFPLENPREDQRNVEIWYQANAYLIERYY